MVKQETIIRVIDTYLDKSHQSLSIHLSFPQVEKAFNSFHKETCGDKIRKTEKAIVVDKDGNKIYEKSDRSKNHVSFDTNHLKDLYDEYGELILTHNHPRDSNRVIAECLSSGDIHFLINNKHRPYGKRPDGSEGFLTEEPVYICKSISCESPNGSRMTLTRGDKFNKSNENKVGSLGSRLERCYLDYLNQYYSVRSEVRNGVSREQFEKQFRTSDGVTDSGKFHDYVSNESLKRLGRFEDTEEFKEIQREFRENNCLLTMDYPYEYTLKD